jgi:NAD(P)-dependent dehydrogenase (short-subunit alcohol dehydrogenase family)
MRGHATFHDLDGASVFITGGGAGIGAALTEGFLAQGARVAFIQRSDAADFVEEVAGRTGVRPLFVPCDVTDVAALRGAIARAAEAHGPVTVLVNNAANDQRHAVEGYTVEEWDRAQAVNLRPHFVTAQAVAPGMKAAGGGSIVNFSSISYMMGTAGYVSYMTAKAAITGLTRGLAREFGPDGIRVNALMPGWVLTRRQLDLWATPEDLAVHLERQCLKEHLVEADIVGGTLFLASKTSRMMTSQALVIDGGVVVTG